MVGGSRASGSSCTIRGLLDRAPIRAGSAPLTGIGGIALRLLVGAGAALGHGPLSLPLLSLIAFSAAFWLHASSRSIKGALCNGWLIGFGYFAVVLVWIVEPFLIHPERHAWMAPVALAGAPAGLALFWAVAFGAAQAIGKGVVSRSVALVCTLVATGMLREVVLTGFPWALPGYIWSETPIVQTAAYVGPHGLTALTLGIASLPIVVRRPLVSVLAATATLSLIWYAGSERISQAALPDATRPMVRLVQPNIGQRDKWARHLQRAFLQRLVDESIDRDGPSDLIIWPEAAVSMRVLSRRDNLEIVQQLGDTTPIIFGAIRRADGSPLNSVMRLGKGGAIEPLYDKRHLVPFGEYLPFEHVLSSWLPMRALAGSAEPGRGPTLISIDGLGSVMPLICYEALFPREVRQRGRPDVILNLTNDAWFGDGTGPRQLHAQTRFRAIELGLPLIRVANTGISSVIDGYGHIVAMLPLNHQGAINARIPPPLEATLYARIGDLAVGTTLVIMLFLICIRPIRNL